MALSLDRRRFLRTTAAGGALISCRGLAAPATPTPEPDEMLPREDPGERGPKTMLFWDYWKFHEIDNAELVQGRPEWRPEGTYIDPHTRSAGTGRVFFDRTTGSWRKIWGTDRFFVARSEDGIRWEPEPHPEIEPHGGKEAPHHVYTLPGEGASYGWVHVDPIASDGFPFKQPVIQKGRRVLKRAKGDPNHRWHELARRYDKPPHHMFDYLYLVSRDGLHWEQRLDYDWSRGLFFPEEPHFYFRNHLDGRHAMTVRPGLGDRRVALTHSSDFRDWTPPRLVQTPDLVDGRIMEFYAMPTFPYGQYFVGFVWASEFSTAEGPDWSVLHKGPQYPQLALSDDGHRFTRPSREPFIPFNDPPELGCHSIRPEGMVLVDDEIRIYSSGGLSAHGTPVPRPLRKRSKGMLLHTLRRDGFFALKSKGHRAAVTTRPFAVFGGEMTMNAAAATGEVEFELRDFRNRPLDGYRFEDCEKMRFADDTAFPLRWRERRNLDELEGRTIRLALRFHNAAIHSLRADYHFTDATDFRRLRDDLPLLETERFGS